MESVDPVANGRVEPGAAVSNWAAIAVLAACYLIGGLSPGYWLVRWRTGEDLREQETGSTGARNVGRRLGVGWAATTFVLDAAKGAVAVALARWLGLEGWALAATPAAVVSGHIWPLQLGFRGGRGLSPGLGAALVLAPPVAVGILVAAALLFPLAAAIGRRRGAVLAAVAQTPLIAIATGQPVANVIGLTAAALICLFAHQAMIRAMIGRPPPASAPGSVGRAGPVRHRRGDDASGAGPAESGTPVPPKGPAL
jgi:glycerol-3-phosphate acyltransferase PlsY